MTKRHPFAGSLFWGFLTGFVTGFSRTYFSTKHLYEKNLALRDAGLIPLPGEGHYETLASLKPALAGGFFYALALGVGTAALAFLFGTLLRFFAPQRRKAFFPFALIPPLLVLLSGDVTLAMALFIIVIPCGLSGLSGEQLRPKEALEPVLATLLLLLSALPVFFSETGGFTMVRNALLNNSALRTVSDFYYEWTLYPAESIKPLEVLSQPVGRVSPEIEGQTLKVLERSAGKLGILLVKSEKGGDFEFILKDGAVYLSRKGVFVLWPEKSQAGQAAAFKEFSGKTDAAKPLRKTMLASLLFGGVLAVTTGLYKLSLLLSAKLRRESFVVLAIILFLLSSRGEAEFVRLEKTASVEEVRTALGSSDPAVRLYGARGAVRYPKELEEDLFTAIEDPVLNVRYSAVTALGGAGSARSREKLLEILKSPREWYVKDRAWWALKRN
ncbi:HEAT repeat domain-containing protein [bacterium]|nr:MAG: HEAT repeat domain-containing protein [bacterium]